MMAQGAMEGGAANVANELANSYMQHTYTLRIRSSANLSSFVERQIEDLKAKMERSGQRQAQFERELNVINPGFARLCAVRSGRTCGNT